MCSFCASSDKGLANSIIKIVLSKNNLKQKIINPQNAALLSSFLWIPKKFRMNEFIALALFLSNLPQAPHASHHPIKSLHRQNNVIVSFYQVLNKAPKSTLPSITIVCITTISIFKFKVKVLKLTEKSSTVCVELSPE